MPERCDRLAGVRDEEFSDVGAVQTGLANESGVGALASPSPVYTNPSRSASSEPLRCPLVQATARLGYGAGAWAVGDTDDGGAEIAHRKRVKIAIARGLSGSTRARKTSAPGAQRSSTTKSLPATPRWRRRSGEGHGQLSMWLVVRRSTPHRRRRLRFGATTGILKSPIQLARCAGCGRGRTGMRVDDASPDVGATRGHTREGRIDPCNASRGRQPTRLPTPRIHAPLLFACLAAVGHVHPGRRAWRALRPWRRFGPPYDRRSCRRPAMRRLHSRPRIRPRYIGRLRTGRESVRLKRGGLRN